MLVQGAYCSQVNTLSHIGAGTVEWSHCWQERKSYTPVYWHKQSYHPFKLHDH